MLWIIFLYVLYVQYFLLKPNMGLFRLYTTHLAFVTKFSTIHMHCIFEWCICIVKVIQQKANLYVHLH